jgi:hypothetical protein
MTDTINTDAITSIRDAAQRALDNKTEFILVASNIGREIRPFEVKMPSEYTQLLQSAVDEDNANHPHLPKLALRSPSVFDHGVSLELDGGVHIMVSVGEIPVLMRILSSALDNFLSKGLAQLASAEPK